MGKIILTAFIFQLLCALSHLVLPDTEKMFPELKKYVNEREAEFDEISAERKQVLERLTDFVSKCAAEKKPCKLIFVCTHNSRRSHLSQAWAQVAAAHYQIPDVECFSGGTEATAMNPRTVAALRRAGIEIKEGITQAGSANPVYLVKFCESEEAVKYFSKCTDDNSNPSKDFGAVMTCTEADKACPMVVGCAFRLALPFQDPKVSDGTDQEAETYDLRCRQIAREMMYVMSRVKKS
jgi:arsenate reductase (thioredoxin)